MEQRYNGESTQKLVEAVETCASLDAACEKVREKQICDSACVKCDLSCRVYVKKDRLLKLFEECINATPPVPLIETDPESEDTPHVESALTPEPVQIQESAPELPKERLYSSCSRKAACEDSKYCDFWGEDVWQQEGSSRSE